MQQTFAFSGSIGVTTKILPLFSTILLSLMFLSSPVFSQQPRGESIVKFYFEELSASKREYVQGTLARSGLYSDDIDGAYGPNTLRGLLGLCTIKLEENCDVEYLGNPQVIHRFLANIVGGAYEPAQGLTRSPDEIVPLGQPELCGTYQAGYISMFEFLPGGEGGVIEFSNPQRIDSCCLSFAFDGVTNEEGFFQKVGKLEVTFAHWAYKDIYVVKTSGKTLEYEVCE